MPIMFVYGIRGDTKQEKLEQLINDLRETVGQVPELGIGPKQVTVFLPADLCATGLGEEIICMVEGLFNRAERTKDVRNRFAQIIKGVLEKHFPNTGLVEVFVKKFHGDDGFASSEA